VTRRQQIEYWRSTLGEGVGIIAIVLVLLLSSCISLATALAATAWIMV